mmetsp:Transcript_127726/g.408921  ORF Transcript_127726/g.408921 Transcript_127726/m.408921 type:complete len:136 (+) Transcript_127726:569-976(+)
MPSSPSRLARCSPRRRSSSCDGTGSSPQRQRFDGGRGTCTKSCWQLAATSASVRATRGVGSDVNERDEELPVSARSRGESGMPVDGSLMACSQHTFRAGELEEGPEESELQDADRPLGEIILGPGPLKDRVLLMA